MMSSIEILDGDGAAVATPGCSRAPAAAAPSPWSTSRTRPAATRRSPLGLTHDDLRARRDRVPDALERRVPIAWGLAGGYTPDVSRVVEVHLGTFVAAVRAREAVRAAGDLDR
ncbi:hypothetical protein WMF18_42885 [Sorangium sp. So ce315]|uniref:hypothetical protein n=1 Tax=Sorangium sp. So ce315 TaxID=3133299 RepID=UPI003F63CAAB